MSIKPTSDAAIRGAVVALIALVALIVWYCVITPKYIAIEHRSYIALFIVLTAQFVVSVGWMLKCFLGSRRTAILKAVVLSVGFVAVQMLVFLFIAVNLVGS
jgi:hypothetical protein